MKMEMGNTHQFASFQMYQRYAEYLDVTLQDIFHYWATKDEHEVTPHQEIHVSISQARQLVLQQYEDVVIEHVQEIMTNVSTLEGKVTLGDIAKHMHHMRPDILKQYPAFNTVWEQVLTNTRNDQMRQTRLYEDELIERVKRAVAILKAEGRSLTRETISGLVVGVSLCKLHYYRRVGYFLRQYPYRERGHL